jgi:hypothetical protein
VCIAGVLVALSLPRLGESLPSEHAADDWEEEWDQEHTRMPVVHQKMDLLALATEARTPTANKLDVRLSVPQEVHVSTKDSTTLTGPATIDVSKNVGVKITYTVKNMDNKPVKFVSEETPFEGKLSNMFVVRRKNGDKIRYVGAQARRFPPEMTSTKDVVILQAGESKSVDIDITDDYEWVADGLHYIRLGKASAPTGMGVADFMATQIEVKIVGTQKQQALAMSLIEERMRDKHHRTQLALVQGGAKAKAGTRTTFKDNCSSQNKADLVQWEKIAREWVDAAAKCTTTTGGSTCTNNIAAWFNPANAGGQSKYDSSVTKTLKNMQTAWANSDYDCNPPQCKASTFAYVYPGDKTQTVYMCPFTFSYSVENEKMQTVIHELSHFNHIGINEMNGFQQGERDLGYGEDTCLNLAKSEPIKAMNNADNVGYFVRDVGTGADPNCRDSSSQCPGWVEQYGCNNNGITVGGKTLTEFCQKSCKTCGSGTNQGAADNSGNSNSGNSNSGNSNSNSGNSGNSNSGNSDSGNSNSGGKASDAVEQGSNGGGSSVCFPSNAMVHMAHGVKQIGDLRVGDQVLSGMDTPTLSDVYFFAHKDFDIMAEFIELSLSNERVLEISAKHFVPVSPSCSGSSHKMYAGSVKEGMCMFSLAEGDDHTELVRVKGVRKVIRQGLHAPYTMAGDLFVNGVLASAHSDWFLDPLAQQTVGVAVLPWVYQLLLQPARFMYSVIGPEDAREHLEAYQEQLNVAAASQLVIKPYLDLGWKAMQILFTRATESFLL